MRVVVDSNVLIIRSKCVGYRGSIENRGCFGVAEAPAFERYRPTFDKITHHLTRLTFLLGVWRPSPPMLLGGCPEMLLCYELDAKFFPLHLPVVLDGASRTVKRYEGAVCDEKSEDLSRIKNQFPTPRDAVDYIIETFPIVRRKDEQKRGEYRTKRVILEIYDEIAEAMRTLIPYKTRLNPPPGPPADEHGNFLPLPEWQPGQVTPGREHRRGRI